MDLMDLLKESYGKKIIVGGHRGHKSNIRENTISNFSQLEGKKIPYIEIDVQLTRDSCAVIYHDVDLSLQTELTGMIRDYTLGELKERFDICTLDEAAAWCKEKQIGIALEIKLQPYAMWDDRKPLVKALVEVIQKYNFHRMCYVFGKDYEMLNWIKREDSRINIGLIAPFVPKKPVALMNDMQAIIYLNFVDQLSRELVEQLHKEGFLVGGSVVNTEEALKIAVELGVDLIESDDPERILGLLEEWYAG